MKATKSFYNKLFGWKYHNEKWPNKIYTIIQKDSEILGGLTDLNQTPLPLETPPHMSVYIAVYSIDDITKSCEKFGGQVLIEPFDLENLMRISVIQDPGGAVFSLLEPGTFQAMNTDRSKEGVPSWFELITPDLNKSVAFYAQIFGWTFITTEKDFTRSLYIQCGEQIIGKMTAASSQKSSPEWRVYYRVKSIEHKIKLAKALGAQQFSAIKDVPHIGKAATFADSVGISFGIFEFTN